LVGQQETEIDTLRWHLLHVEADRDDALWMLEMVRGESRKHETTEFWPDYRRMLQRITWICNRALTPRVDGERE
jgi:hypothetical protein